MRLVRAHDGATFDILPHHLANADSLAALLELVSERIQIPPHQIILMNALGSQLTENSLHSILHPPLQSSPPSPSSATSSKLLSLKRAETLDSTTLLYAFDRQFLSADPSEALNALAFEIDDVIEPPLPSFDSTKFNLQAVNTLALAYHNVGSRHLRTTLLLLSHVRAQKSALQVALNNLDKCREPPQGALEAFETFSQPHVQDYGQLLQAFGPAFALAKMVKIHPALLPSNALVKSNSSSSASNSNSIGLMKVKYLGDYVMEDKILQIRDKCLKVYEDFRVRFDVIRARSVEVNEGSNTLREELGGRDCDLEDLYELEKDADEGFHRIEEVTTQVAQVAQEDEPVEDLAECFAELSVLDEDSRERIACLIERKNFWLHYLVGALNRISHLQGIIPSIGLEVQALNADLKTKTDSFRYLARLKDFVTAYASTVVEVVRRREYVRHLADYASALNNLVSKLSNDERRRRGLYRTEYAGKLPFAVEGLDDSSIPTIEFEIRYIGAGGAPVPKSKDNGKIIHINGVELPPLTRADVDEMLATLRNIEEFPDHETAEGSSPKLHAREIRLLVEKQFARLEAMENAFALAVEKFVMSESESCVAGQPVDAEEFVRLKARVAELEAVQEKLTEKLRVESTTSIAASRKAQQEVQIYIRKVEDLKLQLLSVKEEGRHEKEKIIQDQQPLITELANASGTIEKLNERIGLLEDELKARNKALQDTERLVTSARATADDATRELHELEARHQDHISDHEVVLNQLQQSRDRCTELELLLAECQNRNQVSADLIEDQNQVMQIRAAEAEEVRLRMEKEIFELKARLEDEKQQNGCLHNKINEQRIEIDHITQQSILANEVHAAAESRWKEEMFGTTSRLETHCLKVVRALRSYQQVHGTVKDKIANMPRPGSSQKPAVTAANTTRPPSREGQNSDPSAGTSLGTNRTTEQELPSPSSVEFEALLQSLLEFDPCSLVEVVQQKLDQLSGSIRKWMKDCKGYRERAFRSQEQAQVKITFRDFAKGDLALFLPTRNPSAQVWAAFNVSFPHYFLQANESVAPIIKSREWLVARIVSLTEKMVDPKDPETNPYQLPAGTRYFLLEVEPWSVEKTSRKMAQSMLGGDNAARPRMESQMRSATLPSKTAPPDLSPPSKRRSLVEANTNPLQTSLQPLLSVPGGPSKLVQDDTSRSVHDDASKSVLDHTSKLVSHDPRKSVPAIVSSEVLTKSASSSQPNSAADLSHSEYTVIDRSSSLISPETFSDSPFRTTLGSPPVPSKSSPSGLSLSLKTYQKSPLGSGSSSHPSNLKTLCEPDDLDAENAPEFKPSESARPAFLASLSLSSSPVTRKCGSSTFQPPLKPRLRPVPKATNASRSSSRAPSIASSSNLNPAVKALLKSGTPSSKGTSTVSTTFTSMEKSPSPIQQGSASGETDQLGQSVALIQMVRPPPTSPSGTMSNVIELARRRLSFSAGGTSGYAATMMTIGSSHPGTGGGSSQNSNSSLSGSGLFIGHSPNMLVSARPDGTAPVSRSPSFHTSTSSQPHHQPSPINTHNPNSTMAANSSSYGASGLSGSGFFGTWRKRKESTTHQPAALVSPTFNPNNTSYSQPSPGSLVGASDLLKRFSNSQVPNTSTPSSK